jgi:hypothetical protein
MEKPSIIGKYRAGVRKMGHIGANAIDNIPTKKISGRVNETAHISG